MPVKDKSAVVEEKIITTTRKLRKVGNSFVISVPNEWIRIHGLKDGDTLPIVGNSFLKVVPVNEAMRIDDK